MVESMPLMPKSLGLIVGPPALTLTFSVVVALEETTTEPGASVVRNGAVLPMPEYAPTVEAISAATTGPSKYSALTRYCPGGRLSMRYEPFAKLTLPATTLPDETSSAHTCAPYTGEPPEVIVPEIVPVFARGP